MRYLVLQNINDHTLPKWQREEERKQDKQSNQKEFGRCMVTLQKVTLKRFTLEKVANLNINYIKQKDKNYLADLAIRSVSSRFLIA